MNTYKVFIMDRTARNPPIVKDIKAQNIDNLRKRLLDEAGRRNLSMDIGLKKPSIGDRTRFLGTLESVYVNNRPSWRPSGEKYWDEVDPKTGRLM